MTSEYLTQPREIRPVCRQTIYTAKDKWLGKPFSNRNIHDKILSREIWKVFIDHIYDMLREFSNTSKTTKVWLVDCRNAIPNLTDWADEFHGTSDQPHLKWSHLFRQFCSVSKVYRV